jgi:Holliday junction resolvase RusA-like endonuclease
MSVDIVFPLEFIVMGIPVSLAAANSSSKEAWKVQIRNAARAALQEGFWATDEPVAVTIFYFPPSKMRGDVDNIVKLILDALSKLVYLDDAQVERVLVQKFEPNRTIVFSKLTPILAEAVEHERPVVYVRIDT